MLKKGVNLKKQKMIADFKHKSKNYKYAHLFLKSFISLYRLEVQYNGALERSQIIKEELIMERQASEDLKMQLEELLNRDERSQDELEHLQSLLHEQEEHLQDIQQREEFAFEQMHLLQLGISIQGW